MSILGFLGIDQYGKKYTISKHPRKELLEQIGGQHADKMYQDTKKGEAKHTGYIIAGLWITVYAVSEWIK